MCAQRILSHKLISNPHGQIVVDTTLDVYLGELLALKIQIFGEFLALSREISSLGIGRRL